MRDQTSHNLAASQPLGIFPLPVSYLILPSLYDEKEEATLMRALLNGQVADNFPAEWEFFALAVAKQFKQALECLSGADDVVAAYNRCVLNPAAEGFVRLRSSAPSPLRQMVDIVAYSLGISDELPKTEPLAAEYLAMARSTHAAAAMDQGNRDLAIEHLRSGIDASRESSPLLAAQLLAQLAELLRQDDSQLAMAVRCYREAITFAEHAALITLPAELWLSLGATYHQQAEGRRGTLLEAVKCYQNGVQCGLTNQDHPELFAHAQLQIGLAYLAMPLQDASDQLRMAIALQSFREALKVYTQEDYPQLWATTQLNLANAYQYLPSSHPQENLIEAVKIYDEVLTVRDRATDPLGYARVLLNQSNALAHLGIFSPALEKLTEARKLFAWHNEDELANSAMELASKIHAQMEENRAHETKS